MHLTLYFIPGVISLGSIEGTADDFFFLSLLKFFSAKQFEWKLLLLLVDAKSQWVNFELVVKVKIEEQGGDINIWGRFGFLSSSSLPQLAASAGFVSVSDLSLWRGVFFFAFSCSLAGLAFLCAIRVGRSRGGVDCCWQWHFGLVMEFGGRGAAFGSSFLWYWFTGCCGNQRRWRARLVHAGASVN